MIVKDFAKAEADKFFQFMEYPRTRGHDLRIFEQTCKLNNQKYTFGQIVIKEWNHLPPEAVIAKTENSSKGVIDPQFQQNIGLCTS